MPSQKGCGRRLLSEPLIAPNPILKLVDPAGVGRVEVSAIGVVLIVAAAAGPSWVSRT